MTDTLPFEIERAPKEVRDHYLRMIEKGTSERMAVMLALQQPPGASGTDRAFMEGRYGGSWLNEMPERQARYITQEAKQAGISVSGKYYCSGIADRRGHCDPEAWVSGLDDVKRVAIKRGKSVSGAITVNAPESMPAKSVPINPMIERRLVKEAMQANPKMSRAEATERIRAKHAPRWKRKNLGSGT